MVLSWSIIKSELRTIMSRAVYYIEIIVVPLTLALITIFASANKSGLDGVINYIILLALYGIIQGLLTGSARSLEREKYQDTLSLHFLSNISLWKVVLNKLIANGIIGIINLIINVLFFSLFFETKVSNIEFLILGFILLLILATFMSLGLSYLFLKARSPYAICSILTKLTLLITGIFIPLDVLPKPILLLSSLTGIPQVFNIIQYGLRGVPVISSIYMILLPIVLIIYIYLGIKLINKVEFNYLKLGGV